MARAPAPTSPLTVAPFAARDVEWGGDMSSVQLTAFIARSRALGWRAALSELGDEYRLFAHRLRNLPLGNWHLLRTLAREGDAIDVGCGFGSLALGICEHFRFVVGLDPLWSRVSYGQLRAVEASRNDISFVSGDGLRVPFSDRRFDLVTVNGVLEWAALYSSGGPRALQVEMLREARRILKPDGTLAIAIENRFAMETLLGVTDTHTRLRFVPLLPRRAADVLSRALRHRPYQTYLYSSGGYRKLLREAGFGSIRIFDLVSSYNDYDFVVDVSDAATYRLLWNLRLVRSFSVRAGVMRRFIAKRFAKFLGAFAYAFLILAGSDESTLLDSSHRFWKRAATYGISSGRSRFACQSVAVGGVTVLAHDGERVVSALEIATTGTFQADRVRILNRSLQERISRYGETVAEWEEGGMSIRCVKFRASD